jgi:hypothetical protein
LFCFVLFCFAITKKGKKKEKKDKKKRKKEKKEKKEKTKGYHHQGLDQQHKASTLYRHSAPGPPRLKVGPLLLLDLVGSPAFPIGK